MANRNATRNPLFRGLCWTVVIIATLVAGNGSTAPGGSQLGLLLAAALATALHFTKPKGPRHAGRNARAVRSRG